MSTWVATCYGALDLRGHELAHQGFELIVSPSVPGEPRYLWGAGADAWRRLVENKKLSAEDHATLVDLERLGLASRTAVRTGSPSAVSRPWLQSVNHEMVYALVAQVAASRGIEIMFIKGPTLHAQGLRRREHSGDVDCWVRPGDDLRLAKAMKEWGWTPVFSAFTGTGVAHSLTLNPGSWGCAIDVHSRFPGMAIDPERAFDIVRGAADERAFASTIASVPSVEMHAVIAALHDLRPVAGVLPSLEQQEVAKRALSAAGEGVHRAIESLGAGYVLRDVVHVAFPNVNIDLAASQPPSDWAWRVTKSSPRRVLRAWLLVPWQKKPRVLFRLVWPTKEMVRAGRYTSAEDASHASLASSRLRRIVTATAKFIRGS